MANQSRGIALAVLLFMLTPITHAEYALTDAQRAEVSTMIEAARLSWCADIEAALPEARGRGPCVKVSKIATPDAVVSAPVPNRIVPKAMQPGATQQFSDGTSISQAQNAFLGHTGQTVLDDPVDNGKPRFELTTTTTSSRAGIRWGKSYIGSDGPDEKSFTTLSGTLSTPVSKTGDSNIATLDGFANASTFALNLTRFNMTGFKSPSAKQLQDFVARAGLPPSVLGSDPNLPDVDLDKLQDELRKIGKLSMYSGAEDLYFRGNSLRWTYGANITAGYESDDYFKASTLTPDTKKSTPWSAGGYAGFFPRGSDIYLSTGFDFAHSYKVAKVRTDCPSSTGSPVVCVTGSFGPPSETDKHLLWLAARGELADTGIGLGIKITHDLKDGESGVDLPIYLFRDDKHLLNGGIRVGWTNTDHFAAGLFVGSSFDVTGN